MALYWVNIARLRWPAVEKTVVSLTPSVSFLHFLIQLLPSSFFSPGLPSRRPSLSFFHSLLRLSMPFLPLSPPLAFPHTASPFPSFTPSYNFPCPPFPCPFLSCPSFFFFPPWPFLKPPDPFLLPFPFTTSLPCPSFHIFPICPCLFVPSYLYRLRGVAVNTSSGQQEPLV